MEGNRYSYDSKLGKLQLFRAAAWFSMFIGKKLSYLLGFRLHMIFFHVADLFSKLGLLRNNKAVLMLS